MSIGDNLPRRLAALETKLGIGAETVYLFQMPGEDEAVVVERRFGAAGVPAGTTVTIFTWLPQQAVPGSEAGF